MVPAHNGTKMIVFGGNLFSRGVQGSIYILDLKSLSWTKGAEAEPIQRRSDMACTASGDHFVAWGGETTGSNVNTFGTPIIYNLKTNAWTTEYLLLPEPVPGLTPSPSPSPDPNPSTTSKGVNAAAIGGGAAAAVVLILAILYAHKRHRSSKDTQRLSSHSLLERGKDFNNTAANAPLQEAAQVLVTAREEIPPPAIMQYQHTPVATSRPQEHHVLGPVYQYVPTTTIDHQYNTSQAAERSNQYSPTPTAVYHPPPPTTPAYPMPPVSSSHQDRGGPSSNVKVEKGPDVRTVRNPQVHNPDPEECEPRRSNQPQSRPTSSGSDERLKQEIAFLKAQQEQQYQIQQQNMERLRLEQQELVEMLKKQIKPQ
ncbi:hypothetical protein BGZ72_005875 [Mortierella alpina]|nr:hypothetical protein BGZ72_005875 [Mortierella alpina]